MSLLSAGKKIMKKQNDDSSKQNELASALRESRDQLCQRDDKVLQECEIRYRNLSEIMREGVAFCRMLFDDHGKPLDFVYLDVNSAYGRLTGLEDVKGKRISVVIPGIRESNPELIETYGRVALTGQAAKFEIEVKPLRKWFSVSAYSPEREFFVAVLDDVTERKRSEEALRESEVRYRSLFENMLDGFALCRMLFDDHGQPLDFVYLDVNSAFGRLTGLDGVTGKKVTEVIPGIRESNPELLEIYGRVAMTGQAEKFEIAVEPLGMWFSISAYSPERGYFVAVFDNITERKQAESALRDSERLYRAIGESIDYGVWVCAPDGRCTYASESFLKMVGMTQEQCSNFGWGEVLHPDDAESTISAWKECVRSEGVWDIEHRFRGTDGEWHAVLARGVPVKNDSGEVIFWAGINLDISR